MPRLGTATVVVLTLCAATAARADDWEKFSSGVYEARFPEAPAVWLVNGLPQTRWAAPGDAAVIEVRAVLVDDGRSEKEALEQAFPQGVAIGMNAFKTWLAYSVEGQKHQAVELEWKPGATFQRERELRLGRLSLSFVVRAQKESLARALADQFSQGFALTLPGATGFTFASGYKRARADPPPQAEYRELTRRRGAAPPVFPKNAAAGRAPDWASMPSSWPSGADLTGVTPPWAFPLPPVPALDKSAPRAPAPGGNAPLPGPPSPPMMVDANGSPIMAPIPAGPGAAAANPSGPPPAAGPAPGGAIAVAVSIEGDFFGMTAIISTTSTRPLTRCELRLPVTGTWKAGPAENLRAGAPLRAPMDKFVRDTRPPSQAIARGQGELTCAEGATAVEVKQQQR